MADWSSFSGAFAGGATVQIVIAAIDKYSKEFAKAKTTMQGFTTVAKGFAIAAGVAFAAFAADAIKSAAEAEKSSYRVQQTFGEMSDYVIESSKRMMNESVRDDEEIMDAFVKLQTVAGNTGISVEQMSDVIQVAMDMSAQSGIDFQTIYTQLAMGLQGHTERLYKLGIEVEKGANAQEVYNAVMLYGNGVMDAAKDEIKTLHGSLQVLNRDWKEMKETVGMELAPALVDNMEQIKEITKAIGWGLTQAIRIVLTVLNALKFVVSEIAIGLTTVVQTITEIIKLVTSGDFKRFANNIDTIGKTARGYGGEILDEVTTKQAKIWGYGPEGTKNNPLMAPTTEGTEVIDENTGAIEKNTNSTKTLNYQRNEEGGLIEETTVKIEEEILYKRDLIDTYDHYSERMIELSLQFDEGIISLQDYIQFTEQLKQSYKSAMPIFEDYKKKIDDVRSTIQASINSLRSGTSGRAGTTMYDLTQLGKGTFNLDTKTWTPSGGGKSSVLSPVASYGAKQFGGLVTKPTMTLLGEAGPEMVTPLGKTNGIGGGISVYIGTINGIDATEISRALREELKGVIAY